AIRRGVGARQGVLAEGRGAARRRMVRALRSERAGLLLSRWSSFLDPLIDTGGAGHDAAAPIGTIAGERIAKVYARMVRMGGAIDSQSPSGDYHELRKQGKELRYLLELFGAPLYPAEVVRPMIKSLKAL